MQVTGRKVNVSAVHFHNGWSRLTRRRHVIYRVVISLTGSTGTVGSVSRGTFGKAFDRVKVQGHNFVPCQKIPLPSIFPAFKVKANKATRAPGLPSLFQRSMIHGRSRELLSLLCCFLSSDISVAQVLNPRAFSATLPSTPIDLGQDMP